MHEDGASKKTITNLTYVGYEASLLIIVHHEVGVKARSMKRNRERGKLSLSKPFTKTSQFELNRLAHIIRDGAGTAWSPEK